MQRVVINNPDLIREKIVNYFNKNEESRFIHRLHGILLLLDDKEYSCDKIAETFNSSPRTVSMWASKVNESSDIEMLRDKPKSGRHSRLNDDQKASIKRVLERSPEECGINSNLWDGKSLSFYIEEEYGIALKVRACQYLFRELGFSLKRARPVVAKGDNVLKEESKKT